MSVCRPPYPESQCFFIFHCIFCDVRTLLPTYFHHRASTTFIQLRQTTCPSTSLSCSSRAAIAKNMEDHFKIADILIFSQQIECWCCNRTSDLDCFQINFPENDRYCSWCGYVLDASCRRIWVMEGWELEVDWAGDLMEVRSEVEGEGWGTDEVNIAVERRWDELKDAEELRWDCEIIDDSRLDESSGGMSRYQYARFMAKAPGNGWRCKSVNG